jgi:hypothetical protein
MSKGYSEMVGQYKFNMHLFSGVFPQQTFESDWIKNLITDAGRTLLLNRLASDSATYVTHMAIGTGATAPALANTQLGAETVRKAVTNSIVGTPNWKVTFNAIFTAAEINTTTEVGLLNASSNGTLVTRNTHDAISIPAGSSMGIDYIITLNTGKIGTEWTKTEDQNYVYEITDAVEVKAVVELDTGNGYALETSVANVDATANTYYSDGSKIYVHCSDDEDGDTHTILIISGG